MRAVAEGHEWQQRPPIVYRGIGPLRDAVPRLDLWSSCVVEAYDGNQRYKAFGGALGCRCA